MRAPSVPPPPPHPPTLPQLRKMRRTDPTAKALIFSQYVSTIGERGRTALAGPAAWTEARRAAGRCRARRARESEATSTGRRSPTTFGRPAARCRVAQDAADPGRV